MNANRSTTIPKTRSRSSTTEKSVRREIAQ
jgi:hypothetical protein